MSTYEISKSSLLSLKAEILRKQDELVKAKIDNNIKIAQHIKKSKPLDIKNKGVENRMQNDSVEDEDLLKKSREALEAKSKLYDKLLKSNINEDDGEELNKRYLVRFDKKSKEYNKRDSSSEDDAINEDDYTDSANPEDEWIEYTDCLGRTRKCLRKDLEHIKQNDAELRERMEGRVSNKEDRKEPNEPKAAISNEDDKEVDDNFNESSELLSNDMRRELMRKQWEKEEDELRNKTNIHYQDVLFNEARSHGVGYYQFSKDEDERKKQQEALKNLRKETQKEQQRAQDLKQLREKQLKARIKAARNRRRARMGLQPEEESDNEETVVEKQPEVVVEPSPEEKKKDEKRKNHVRPWDIGKEGAKEHYIHTQDEWNEKKRKERPSEFAPPTEYRRCNKEDKKSLYFTSKKRRYSSEESDEEAPPPKGINPYKNYSTDNSSRKHFGSTIINEVDSDEPDQLMQDYAKIAESNKQDRKRAEIAPPSSYEPDKVAKVPTVTNIAESIDAGLKFLRMQTEKKSSNSRSTDMFLE